MCFSFPDERRQQENQNHGPESELDLRAMRRVLHRCYHPDGMSSLVWVRSLCYPSHCFLPSLCLSLVLTLLCPWLRHCLSVFYMTLLLSTVVWRDTMHVYFIKISILSHVVHKICLYSIKYEMCYKYRLYSMKIWTVIYVTVLAHIFLNMNSVACMHMVQAGFFLSWRDGWSLSTLIDYVSSLFLTDSGKLFSCECINLVLSRNN